MADREVAPAAGSEESLTRAINRRANELRVTYPEVGRLDVDVLFMAYLLETSRFGLFSYGPITIDVSAVEDRFLRNQTLDQGAPHEYSESLPAFYERLATETARSGTRRPNELHFLLAFMRTPDGLPAEVFGELAVEPQSVEAFARRQATGPGSGAFLSPEEVARRLDVNVQTVRAWIRSGKLPASRLAGRRILRIRESDLSALLEPVDPSDFA